MDEMKRKHLEDRLREMLQRLKKSKRPEKKERPVLDPVDDKGVIRRRRGRPDKRIAHSRENQDK
jgi:hypothetical protein